MTEYYGFDRNLLFLTALCVPSTCTFKEVELVINEKLKQFFNTSHLLFEVQVRKEMCQVKEDNLKYDFGTKAAM